MADERPSGHSPHELTIFISYRRSDTRADAGRLYDALRRRFGKDQLFMDVDSLQPGQDWVTAVEEAVTRSDVLLALIGDDWSTVVDAAGRRRIDDDLDRVRLEIEAALKQNKLVIPVLFEDAHMPTAEEIPPSLQSLRRRHAMRLAHDTFRYDLEPLIHSLRQIEVEKRTKLGLPPKTERAERHERAAARTGDQPTVTAASTVVPPAIQSAPLATQATPPIAATRTPTPVRPTPVRPPPPPPPSYKSAAQAVAPTPPVAPAQAWTYPQHSFASQQSYAAPPAYSGQWPSAQKAGAAANPFSLVAFVLSVIALLLYPIIFGPIGIVLGIIGKSRKEPWANLAIIVAIGCTVIGFLLGALVYLAT